MLAALTSRRATFLTGINWETVMPEHLAAPASFYGLCHRICELPVLLEESDLLKGCSSTDGLLTWARTHLKSCLATAQRLQAWFDWSREIQGRPTYWAVPASLSNPADEGHPGRLFPFSLEFEDLDAAVICVMTWTAQVHLYCNMVQTFSFLQERAENALAFEDVVGEAEGSWFPSHGLELSIEDGKLRDGCARMSLPSITAEADKLARYICQSVEYCFRLDMGTFGPQSITYAVWTVTQYFRQRPGCAREFSWVRNIYNMKGAPGYWTGFGNVMMKFRGSDRAELDVRQSCSR